jgi:hypothetical protein
MLFLQSIHSETGEGLAHKLGKKLSGPGVIALCLVVMACEWRRRSFDLATEKVALVDSGEL